MNSRYLVKIFDEHNGRLPHKNLSSNQRRRPFNRKKLIKLCPDVLEWTTILLTDDSFDFKVDNIKNGTQTAFLGLLLIQFTWLEEFVNNQWFCWSEFNEASFDIVEIKFGLLIKNPEIAVLYRLTF